MKTIKAILVGAGARGAKAYAPYALKYPQEIQFVGVAEPIAGRRQAFCKEHQINPKNAHDDYSGLLKSGIEADVALICTQDQLHLEPAIMALQNGYHVLLEKPIVSPQDCMMIEKEVAQTGKRLTICHVLRYTPFFKKIKELIDKGTIGQVIAVTHNENVGYFHAAHSYVRGNWNNSDKSSPMILAKSCHDIDILMWLVGDKCRQVSSFGSLKHFKAENAPSGAGQRCIDCAVSADCPYNAVKIYMNQQITGWPVNVITDDLTPTGREKALIEGDYGKCVYHSDNNVVDHQAVIMEFEQGTTVTFHMNAFTYNIDRTIRVSGSQGEIIGDMDKEKLVLHTFVDDRSEVVAIDKPVASDYGHGGGDFGLMKELVRSLDEDQKRVMSSDISSAVESHMVTFAIEQARLENRVVLVEDFKKAIRSV